MASKSEELPGKSNKSSSSSYETDLVVLSDFLTAFDVFLALLFLGSETVPLSFKSNGMAFSLEIALK